jgi:uncharacterized protein
MSVSLRLFVTLFALVTGSSFAIGQTLIVVGSADISVMPDQATITLDTRSRNKDGAKAQAENIELNKKLQTALAKQGVKTELIRTISSTFRRDAQSDGKGNIVEQGFIAENTIEVDATDFKLLPRIITAAVANGATNVGDPAFSLSDDTKSTDQARILAFKNANEEAQKSAAVANLKLGSIVKIAVGAAAFSNDMALGMMGGAMSRKNTGHQANESTLEPNLTVANIHISYAVTIEYELK